MTPERWAVLKTLFDKALAVPHDGRGAFLTAACADDRSLERSLAALLEHHEAAVSVLAGPVLTADRLAEIVSSGVRTFVPGELVGARFRVRRFIAEGGMGEVYAADDLELGETVALKTVRPLLAGDPGVLARFKQEILLARKVTHRNVSRIFDLFRHDIDLDGASRTVVFLSMELLEGETLADRIRRLGALPIAEARQIAVQLVAGLDAAHLAGIIHRDFKCSNIVLVPEPGRGERAVIMDFGLAGTREGLDTRARSGMAGTPAYMAPEQVENGPIGPATDIYALGIVLFEMVSGAVPFQGASPLETARLRLVQDAPLLRKVAPHAPPEWERTVQACLQRDPSKRPASGNVAARLTGRFERRRRMRSAGAVILFAALCVSGWFWVHRPHRPLPAAQAAVDNARVKLQYRSPAGFRDAIGDLHRATELDPQWAEPWAELAYSYADAANTSQVAGATAAVEARRAALQAIRLDSRSAKAYGTLGWVQSFEFDEWPRAEANLRLALSLDPADPHLHYWLGVHLRKKGKFAEAEAEDRQALTLSHQTDPQIWCELAFLYWTSGRLDRMQDLMKDLLVAYPNFGLTRYLHARLLKEQGRYDDALAELRFSESLQYSPVTVLVERASVEAWRGNAAQALRDLDVLERNSKSGPVDGLLMAGVYVRLGRLDTALDWLEKSYVRRDSTLLSMATSPVVKPLHAEPRFAALLRRLHFDPGRFAGS
jgi:tetratricopeptide (TPR) repeat protein